MGKANPGDVLYVPRQYEVKTIDQPAFERIYAQKQSELKAGVEAQSKQEQALAEKKVQESRTQFVGRERFVQPLEATSRSVAPQRQAAQVRTETNIISEANRKLQEFATALSGQKQKELEAARPQYEKTEYVAGAEYIDLTTGKRIEDQRVIEKAVSEYNTKFTAPVGEIKTTWVSEVKEGGKSYFVNPILAQKIVEKQAEIAAAKSPLSSKNIQASIEADQKKQDLATRLMRPTTINIMQPQSLQGKTLETQPRFIQAQADIKQVFPQKPIAPQKQFFETKLSAPTPPIGQKVELDIFKTGFYTQQTISPLEKVQLVKEKYEISPEKGGFAYPQNLIIYTGASILEGAGQVGVFGAKLVTEPVQTSRLFVEGLPLAPARMIKGFTEDPFGESGRTIGQIMTFRAIGGAVEGTGQLASRTATRVSTFGKQFVPIQQLTPARVLTKQQSFPTYRGSPEQALKTYYTQYAEKYGTVPFGQPGVISASTFGFTPFLGRTLKISASLFFINS